MSETGRGDLLHQLGEMREGRLILGSSGPQAMALINHCTCASTAPPPPSLSPDCLCSPSLYPPSNIFCVFTTLQELGYAGGLGKGRWVALEVSKQEGK